MWRLSWNGLLDCKISMNDIKFVDCISKKLCLIRSKISMVFFCVSFRWEQVLKGQVRNQSQHPQRQKNRKLKRRRRNGTQMSHKSKFCISSILFCAGAKWNQLKTSIVNGLVHFMQETIQSRNKIEWVPV